MRIYPFQRLDGHSSATAELAADFGRDVRRAGAATEGHTLSHTAKPGGDHGFSAFPAIDL